MTPPIHRSGPGPDIERLLARARRDPASRSAARTLQWAIHNRDPNITDGSLLAWLRLWEQGMRPTIVTDGIAEQHQLNQLARAALRVAGHLTGPDIQLRTGLRVAAGDQLLVTTHHRPGEPDALAEGALLHITHVDRATAACGVEIPTVGEHRDLNRSTPLVWNIGYAYATTREAEQGRNPPGTARQPERGLSW
jgi:hypothetical protein